MSVATKQPQPRSLRRIWRVPTSRARWFWLAGCLVVYIGIYFWYLYAVNTQQDPEPLNDPLRFFGITSFVLVLSTATYELRRRFARGLPGKVQNWLWMHMWVGIAAILIALLHENYAHVTHDFCQNAGCLTGAEAGGGALLALFVLVLSGVFGRWLDIWQTHVIAHDASMNGVGIVSALEERILELEYTIERLCAGKSEGFKQFCLQTLEARESFRGSGQVPSLGQAESTDFQRAYDTLIERARLVQSLRRQQRARWIIRIWRSAHIVLATVSLLVITFHAVMELLMNVFHIIPAA